MKLSIKQKTLFLWLVSVISGSISLCGMVLLNATGDPDSLIRFIKIYQAVRSEYFLSVNDTQLLEGASRGMVASLEDPYSQFLSTTDFEKLEEQTNGEYGGIGVIIGTDNNEDVHILSIFPQSAAEKAGLLPGDIIVAVDNVLTSSMDINKTANCIRGHSGTEVTLTILRNEETQQVSLIRSNITLPTVDGQMLTEDTGYIRIYSFTSHTPDEFREQYDLFLEKGMAKLVLDLRMNPGGLIDAVVAVADHFLSGGPIVSYQEKNGAMRNYVIQGTRNVLPMAVLIDRNSASAAEILAGAIQDKKEGVIVGERSFGKGTVQIVHSLQEGGALKLSVAQYLTAAGRQIDKIGIEPDIPIDQTGRMWEPLTDNVLQAAIQAVNE